MYRLTYKVIRSHYGHWRDSGTVTKTKSRRAMLASVKASRPGGNTTMRIIKIEEAIMLPYEDVTSQYLPSEGAASEDPAQGSP